MSRRSVIGRLVASAIVVALAAIVLSIARITAYTDTLDPTGNHPHIEVVRSPLTQRVVRVLPANTPRSWVGFFAEVHNYPAGTRWYLIRGGGARDLTYVRDPASGRSVGLSGILSFHLNDHDVQAANYFDHTFGSQRHWDSSRTKQYNAWEGDAGWNAFLQAVVLPEVAQKVTTLVPPAPRGMTTDVDPGLSRLISDAVAIRLDLMTSGFLTDVHLDLYRVDTSRY